MSNTWEILGQIYWDFTNKTSDFSVHNKCVLNRECTSKFMLLHMGASKDGFLSTKERLYQWPFQEPKLEVPTIYKAYVREYSPKIWPYMVQYLHSRILKFPLTIGKTIGIKHPMTVMTNNHDIGIQPGTKSGEEASEMGICMGVVAKIGHIKLQFNGNMMINNESFGLVCSSKSTKPPCLYL